MVYDSNLPARRRVLMLTNDRQIDRRILLQADSLQEAGWQVVILAMPLDDLSIDDDPRVLRIGAEGGAGAPRERRVLGLYRLVRRRLSMNGWLMRKLKSFAWRFVVDHERFYTNLFIADGRRIVSDVVVAHDLPMLPVGRILADEFCARLVYDSHELYSEQEFAHWQRRRWAAIEAKYIATCDRVITVNPSIAAELESRYGIGDVAVIHNAERTFALGERSWCLHERFCIPREHPILLFQGGFSAGRNLVALVEAMALVEISVHLVLLGHGQLSKALARLIARRGLRGRVHLHPAVSQCELLSVTRAADAGVIPYQATCMNNLYCTPNKLFEFVAAGLPILASDLPELRRLVQDNEIGRVADMSTPASIATAVNDFFASEQKLEFWRGRLSGVREALSWQRESECLKNIYEVLA